MGTPRKPIGGTSKDLSPLLSAVGAMFGVPIVGGGLEAAPEVVANTAYGDVTQSVGEPRIQPFAVKSKFQDFLSGGQYGQQAAELNAQQQQMLTQDYLRKRAQEQAFGQQKDIAGLEHGYKLGEIGASGDSQRKNIELQNTLGAEQSVLAHQRALEMQRAGVLSTQGIPYSPEALQSFNTAVVPNRIGQLAGQQQVSAEMANSTEGQNAMRARILAENYAPGIANWKNSQVQQRPGEQTFYSVDPATGVPMAHPKYLPYQQEHMETIESGGTVVDGQRIGGKTQTIKRTTTQPGGEVLPIPEREDEIKRRIAERFGNQVDTTPFYKLGTGPLSSPEISAKPITAPAVSKPSNLPPAEENVESGYDPKTLALTGAHPPTPETVFNRMKASMPLLPIGGNARQALMRPFSELAAQELQVRPQQVGSSVFQRTPGAVYDNSEDLQKQFNALPPDIKRRIYTQALDAYMKNPESFSVLPQWNIAK